MAIKNLYEQPYSGAGVGSVPMVGKKAFEPLSTGTGFLVSGLLQIGGAILGSLFREKPKLTTEQQMFVNMTKFYSNLGRKSAQMRQFASMYTGKPVSSLGKIGYNDAVDAFNRYPKDPFGVKTKPAVATETEE